MISETLWIAAPNSQILLTDEVKNRHPGLVRAAVAVGRNGLALPTLMSQDGDTEVRVIVGSGPFGPQAPDLAIVFEGRLSVPSRVLALSSVDLTVYRRIPVGSDRPRIRVATNHHSEPNIIELAIDSSEHPTA